ncbi:MAG TPA: type II toxin-antitoxin system prevent-host-death family antitoxin, partial [Acetobacteraceae bacterium]|nr:type II toxin-antitoxin system prevent-host-death family antitoxin [Acetobacteraceae bacterium]
MAAAKALLSDLVERASSGETVQITRRGKPVAQLTAIETPRK